MIKVIKLPTGKVVLGGAPLTSIGSQGIHGVKSQLNQYWFYQENRGNNVDMGFLCMEWNEDGYVLTTTCCHLEHYP